jgi:hypothetical protein
MHIVKGGEHRAVILTDVRKAQVPLTSNDRVVTQKHRTPPTTAKTWNANAVSSTSPATAPATASTSTGTVPRVPFGHAISWAL